MNPQKGVTMSSETIGLHQRPAAPPVLDQESPEFVKINRWRGYPENPFDRACRRFLPGASSVGKTLDSNGSMLKNWAAKVTREAAADLRKETATMTKAEALEAIKAEANTRMDRSRLIGNDVHLYTALVDAGRYADRNNILGKWDGAADNLIRAWEAFKEDLQPRFGLIERTGYTGPLADGDPETRVAGTIDRLAVLENPPKSAELNIRPGIDMVILDLKTKAGKTLSRVDPMPSQKIQAHALGAVTHIAYEAERDLMPLPAPIVAVALVFLAEDGYAAYFDMTGQPFIHRTVANCARFWHVERNWTQGAYGTPVIGYLESSDAMPNIINLTPGDDRQEATAPTTSHDLEPAPGVEPAPEPEPAPKPVAKKRAAKSRKTTATKATTTEKE